MRYYVTGDFSRTVYSRHHTFAAAERSARRLWRKWGWCHPGSEPRIVDSNDNTTVPFSLEGLPG